MRKATNTGKSIRATAWAALLLVLIAGSLPAQAQVGPQSMKYLVEMPGHVALQRLMLLPPPPGARPDEQAAAFAYDAKVHAQAMNEAAQLMSKGGASVGSISRLTGSGYFTNAARKYAAGVGLPRSQTHVAQAVAAQIAICLQAQTGNETSAERARQLLQQVQARLAPQAALASMSDADKQAMAESVNLQTGLAYWVIEGRKRSSGNNNELAYYCMQSLKRLGFDLDKLAGAP